MRGSIRKKVVHLYRSTRRLLLPKNSKTNPKQFVPHNGGSSNRHDKKILLHPPTQTITEQRLAVVTFELSETPDTTDALNTCRHEALGRAISSFHHPPKRTRAVAGAAATETMSTTDVPNNCGDETLEFAINKSFRSTPPKHTINGTVRNCDNY